MIGCTVKPTSRSGWRGMRSRLRRASTSVSETDVPERSSRCVLLASSAAWPVSCRKTSSSVGRARRRCRRSRRRPRRAAGPPPRSSPRRSRDGTPHGRRPRATGSVARERRKSATARWPRGSRRPGWTSSRSPPTGPSARPASLPRSRSPWSITAIRSASRSASSRYCVVSSTVAPSRDEPLDRVPERDPAARVDARSSARRGTAQAAARPAPPPGRAAGASRRSRCARAGRRRRRGRTPRAAPCALARLWPAEVVEPPDHLEVLEAGQVLVDRRVLAGEPDLLANLRRIAEDVEPGDARRALVGLRAASSGSAPPSSCRRRSGRAGRRRSPFPPQVHAVERDHLPVALAQPGRLDRELARHRLHATQRGPTAVSAARSRVRVNGARQADRRADRAAGLRAGREGDAPGARRGGRADAHQRARARQPEAAHAARAGQRGPAAEGLVARRERERDRPHGDQRPLLGAHPDRHEHRAEAPTPADQAPHRAVRRPRLQHDERRCRGRGRPRRTASRRRDVHPPGGARGIQPLPRRARDPQAAGRDLRGARADRDHLRGAAGDHLAPRGGEPFSLEAGDRPRRRRARHGDRAARGSRSRRAGSRCTRSPPRRSTT